MDWAVHLSGTERDLELLVEELSDDPRVFERNGEYYLQSTRVASCRDALEARRTAEDQLTIIEGVRLFELRPSCDLVIEGVGELGPDGFRAQSARAGMVTVLGPVPEHIRTMPDFESVDDYCRLADEDPVVRDLIDLLLRGSSWVNLYRIFEFVTDHPIDDESVVSKGWMSESEISSFKRTANSRGAIGNDARHATAAIPPPEEPMDASRAAKVIGGLARNWLNERLARR